MAPRSLLALGLLAVSALAAPPPAYPPPPPPPPPPGKTVTVTKTKTTTEHETKTKTKTTTVTVGASQTVTITASGATVTASCASAPSSTASSSGSLTTSVSSSSGASSATTTSVNTNPTVTYKATATATNTGLNDAAKAAGKLWFGTAADIPGTGEAEDPYYIAEFDNTHDFGESTPANIMKWMFVEPQQNMTNFTGGDEFVSVAKAAGKQIRCHNLVWKSELPTWITSPSTPWTNATLLAAMKNHIYQTVTHFGDDCYSWDVVNEALADNPAGAWDNSSIFYQVIGPEYFYQAFAEAERAVKDNNLSVKLYYNDYNIETAGAKSTAAQNMLVGELKARNIQIDGVGFESHFIVGESPSKAGLQSNIEAFVDLGVEVVLTELDIRTTVPPTAALEAQQKLDYYNAVAGCVAVEKCVGIVVWDFDGKLTRSPALEKTIK